jgi:hypothetical protein
VLVGCLPEQLLELFDELESAGVFSRNGNGVIYSRRMTRDNKRRITAQKNGKNGGNKALTRPHLNDGEQTQNFPWDKGEVKGGVKGGDKHKEARSQKPDKRDSLSSIGDLDPRAAAEGNHDTEPEPYLALGEWIVQTAGMSGDPRRHPLGIVRQWLADYGEDAIRTGVKAVMDRPGQKRPGSLNYFADAIRDAAAAPAEERMAYARSFTADFTERRWLEYLAEWSKGLPWPGAVIGPEPNMPGTLVWPELLERYKAKFGTLEPDTIQREVA